MHVHKEISKAKERPTRLHGTWQSSRQRHLPLPLHIYHERYGSLACNKMCHQYLLPKMLDIHDTHVYTNLPHTGNFNYMGIIVNF